MNPLPPAPDGALKQKFAAALRTAEFEVAQCITEVCTTWGYTGAGLVGERAWTLGWRATICEAAVCCCKVSDNLGYYPIDAAIHVRTRGAISHESIAHDLGWLKVLAPPSALRAWLKKFTWQEDEDFFAHPAHRGALAVAGLTAVDPRPPTRHAPEAGAPPQDEIAGTTLLARRGERIACFARLSGWLICDPSALIVGEEWTEFCAACGSPPRVWTLFRWRGIDCHLRSTGGDEFYGVPADTGLLIRLPYAQALKNFKLMLDEKRT
jgi:hypothetical protein